MDKEEFKLEKKLLEMKHKFIMEEIEAKRIAHLDVENTRLENEKSVWRLKRADRKRFEANKEAFSH